MNKCLPWGLAAICGILFTSAHLFADPESAIALNPKRIERTVPARELIYESMRSYGNWKLLGNAEGVKLFMAGVEYDREVRFRMLWARIDYAAELLPVVILRTPKEVDIEGDPLTARQKITPGIGIVPVGFRLLWRDGRTVMPYFQTNAMVLGFTAKALTPWATYENWSFRSTAGLKVRLRGQYDLRLGLINDTHFSNAWIVHSNPGTDLMNVSVGLVYRLNARRGRTK